MIADTSVETETSSVSYFEVVKAKCVGLVFEDIVAKCSQQTGQQHWNQYGRHGATRVGVATGGMRGNLERWRTNTCMKNCILRTSHHICLSPITMATVTLLHCCYGNMTAIITSGYIPSQDENSVNLNDKNDGKDFRRVHPPGPMSGSELAAVDPPTPFVKQSHVLINGY